MRFSLPIFRLKQNARALARADGIALHKALDLVAQAEGFERWSLLARRAREAGPDLGRHLPDGALVLVAGRPEQGKTLLALDVVARHVMRGGHGAVFSLDETDVSLAQKIARLGHDLGDVSGRLTCCTRDDISADVIADWMREVPRGSVAVLDYLQILDQRRASPPLEDQVRVLRDAAQVTGVTLLCLGQVDRRFDLSGRAMPGPEDVRMPNPVDLGQFGRHVFLHAGEVAVTG